VHRRAKHTHAHSNHLKMLLLAGPRLKRRFLKFLELSGVGRVITDGADEDGARAVRTDE